MVALGTHWSSSAISIPGPLAFILLVLGSIVPSALWRCCSSASSAGRSGVRHTARRLLQGRIGLRWYLAVLALTMLAPLAVGVSILMGGATPVVGQRPFSASCSCFAFIDFPGQRFG